MANQPIAKENRDQLLSEISRLRERLQEAQETLGAIQSGAVDALVINGQHGLQVFTLDGAQTPYRIIVEAMTEGSVTISQSGDILYCNTHFSEMVGCPLEKAIGSSLLQFISAEYHNVIDAFLKDGHASLKTEVDLTRCNGQFLPVLLSTSPLPSDYGLEGHCLVITDLSQQKQTEATLRQYAEQNARLSQELRDYAGELEQRVQERTAELEQINRELEAFTYTVSHDLRAPLRSIDGFAQILARSYRDQLTDKGQLYIDKIIENANDLSNLLDALLTLSRHGRKTLEKKLIRPAELVNQVLRELGVTPAEDRLVIHVDEMPSCLADPILLKQVYVNLLSNAIKFSALRRPAIIEVGCRISTATLDGAAGGAKERAYFVRDNGVGLNMEMAHDLFGVFQRYHDKKEFEGNGVGLAIVQRIIHRHGGRIWMESADGQGATVYFTLNE